MRSDLVPYPFPRVPTWRRFAALGVDVLVVTLLSTLLGSSEVLRFLGFSFCWLSLRVFLVAKNQGQSLGRWAFDLKVIHTQLQRTPGLLELTKREAITGIGVFLALVGISRLDNGNAGVLLYLMPLGIDCGAVLFDMARHPQALHDRVSQTLVVGCQRGYSLDIKIRNSLDKIQQRMKK